MDADYLQSDSWASLGTEARAYELTPSNDEISHGLNDASGDELSRMPTQINSLGVHC
jgi:hypothetical protein